MRKWVKDLTFDDYIQLIEHNKLFEEYALDKAIDTAYFWVGEYLTGAPRSVDYSYFGRGEYFDVNEADRDFIDWIDDIQRSYEWLDEDTYNKCKRAYELWQVYEYGDMSDEAWAEYEALKDEIGDEIFAKMKAEYNSAFDTEVQADILMSDPEAEEVLFDDYERSYVNTDTWEIHNIDDEEDEDAAKLDYDLDEQLELPTL